ncbi:hypothetical protein PoB_006317400 [Plakobranchus ocellatus]|uniref:Uncharacterized protein n=1 Tax=Plakobranchus ocellatus TaxID=259542 RepID=A0AAV4CXP5_9GAST|nr:hypothetical protein PoB_006317400 [Plakobranchus ocellatus]
MKSSTEELAVQQQQFDNVINAGVYDSSYKATSKSTLKLVVISSSNYTDSGNGIIISTTTQTMAPSSQRLSNGSPNSLERRSITNASCVGILTWKWTISTV